MHRSRDAALSLEAVVPVKRRGPAEGMGASVEKAEKQSAKSSSKKRTKVADDELVLEEEDGEEEEEEEDDAAPPPAKRQKKGGAGPAAAAAGGGAGVAAAAAAAAAPPLPPEVVEAFSPGGRVTQTRAMAMFSLTKKDLEELPCDLVENVSVAPLRPAFLPPAPPPNQYYYYYVYYKPPQPTRPTTHDSPTTPALPPCACSRGRTCRAWPLPSGAASKAWQTGCSALLLAEPSAAPLWQPGTPPLGASAAGLPMQRRRWRRRRERGRTTHCSARAVGTLQLRNASMAAAATAARAWGGGARATSRDVNAVLPSPPSSFPLHTTTQLLSLRPCVCSDLACTTFLFCYTRIYFALVAKLIYSYTFSPMHRGWQRVPQRRRRGTGPAAGQPVSHVLYCMT